MAPFPPKTEEAEVAAMAAQVEELKEEARA